MLRAIRKYWKDFTGEPFKLSYLEEYAAVAKNYLIAKKPGDFGLCSYATYNSTVGSPYVLWFSVASAKGSVAFAWQQKPRAGGRTPARIMMVKALIKELEAVIEKDKHRKR